MTAAHPLETRFGAPDPFGTARAAAFDRLCQNMLTGAPSLDGVGEEYRRTLRIERALSASGRVMKEKG